MSHLYVQVGSASHSLHFCTTVMLANAEAEVINAPASRSCFNLFLKSQNYVNIFDTGGLIQKCLHWPSLQWSQPRRVVQSTTHKRERQEGCWGAWVGKYQHQNYCEILIHIVAHL